MRMNAPKVITWLIAVAIGVVGILLRVDVLRIAQLKPYEFWVLAVGFVVLALANLFKKL
ncbi:MAG: hypothetical protein ONB37_18735 [candidate division KSB1 bacterium]|nr:hypothetical protein [candidate division KSB1 bacterium]